MTARLIIQMIETIYFSSVRLFVVGISREILGQSENTSASMARNMRNTSPAQIDFSAAGYGPHLPYDPFERWMALHPGIILAAPCF